MSNETLRNGRDDCYICGSGHAEICESVNTEVVSYSEFGRTRQNTYCRFHDPEGMSVEYPVVETPDDESEEVL